MQAAFEKVTELSGSAVDHNTQYYYNVEQEPSPDVPPSKHNHYANPPNQRNLKELDLYLLIQQGLCFTPVFNQPNNRKSTSWN